MAKNPLFNLLGGGQSNLPPNMLNLMNQFQQFRQTFQGDPKKQVQELLNTGKISQADYTRAAQMATELQKMMNG